MVPQCYNRRSLTQMPRHPRFKDPAMQALYEFHLKTPPRARGGSLQNAYFGGLAGEPNRLWPKNSLAYAAYAAGRVVRMQHATRREEKNILPEPVEQE